MKLLKTERKYSIYPQKEKELMHIFPFSAIKISIPAFYSSYFCDQYPS